MTRAMNSLILTRAHYRRRYGNEAPEMSIPSRFLEEVPTQLVENLGGRSPQWSTPGYPNSYGGGSRLGKRRAGHSGDFADKHYNYEDESQEAHGLASNASPAKPFVASWMNATAKSPAANLKPATSAKDADAPPDSIDNIARFFGGKPGALKPGAMARPAMDIPEPRGAANLKKGQRVRHGKYGEGTVVMRDGDGEDAKLTVLFTRHGMKKLMEKFANLQKI
jgi:DNA helicase-2/ATP-dependent DNA helicase PcrA